MSLLRTILDSTGASLTRTEARIGNEAASIFYLFSATIASVLMMAWAKLHFDLISPVQTQFFRGLFVFILIYIVSANKKIPLSVADRSQDKMRIVRNLIASLFDVAAYYVLTKIPMSTVLLIQTSSPFIVAFIDHFIYKTTYTKTQVLFAFISMFGVTLIIKPDLFFNIEISEQQYGYAEGFERIFWIIVFLVSVAAWSGSVVMLKVLSGMNTMALNIPFGVCISVSSALLEIEYVELKNPPYWMYLQAFVFMGLCSFVDQMGFVRANQLGNPAKLTMLNNMNIVFSFLFEIYYLNETREWYSFVGAILIVGSSIALSISRSKHPAAKQEN